MLGQWGGSMVTPLAAVQPIFPVQRWHLPAIRCRDCSYVVGNFLEPHESRGGSARLPLPCTKPMYVASPGHYVGEGAMVEADPFCVSPGAGGTWVLSLGRCLLFARPARLPISPLTPSCVDARRRSMIPPQLSFCGTHLWPRAPSFAFSLCLCA